MRVLVAYAHYTDRLSYFDDWLDAFTNAPDFEVIPFNIVPSDSRSRLAKVLKQIDAVVLLHSTNADTTIYLEPHIATLVGRKVPLLTFVGNEVNLPGSPIAEKLKLFAILKPDYVATQLLLEAGRHLFDAVASRKVVAVPHALNPAVYYPAIAFRDRPLDIGARAARYLPHLGDDDRNRILKWFKDHGTVMGLKTEISDRRLDRKSWAHYLNQCRGTVSTEAGSWFLERDDAVVNAIRDYALSDLRRGFVLRNDSPLRRIGHRLPGWVRATARKVMRSGPIQHEALFNEQLEPRDIFERFFAERPRPSYYGKCISSRHFDAAGTKTCQIMFRGRFNDILVANEHYIALEPDFSNIDEVLAAFRDPAQHREIVEAAYDLVYSRHTYAQRTQQVYDLLASTS
ncbi:glycosyltransferase [Bradyrhizobium sp. JYMT SZCCT0428]|uniref:glycosyltransferase n=1 Tax=Bradyrhizobium sp. JYMT SZCCT0428 TaxID=2807673 RepID=UPI001BAE1F5A|nr:glycosyltransferase [Bradyrhizobium sp. JYMT SZCCT0428]MBR1156995.1 glycosyltransferase family 1 protein [Bradyrhizobium sp. JYMT SZCCT0428]